MLKKQGWNTVAFLTMVPMLLLGAAACSKGAASELPRLKQLAERCPKDSRPAAYAGLDESGTGRSAELTKARLAALEGLAAEVAVCSGHLRVVAFSSSAAATVTLFNDDLSPPGATMNARLLRVPKIVKALMSAVERGLPGALRRLPADGSDILAQLALAKEFHEQLGSEFQLYVLLETDGVSTTGIVTNTSSFTKVAAADLAERIPVPNLAGSKVTFAGLGKIAGPAPPTAYIDALKLFYDRTCVRTKAQACLAVTDFQAAQGR